jgi:hypothetical protein
VFPSVGKLFFSFPECLNQFWSPPIFPFSGEWGLFSWGARKWVHEFDHLPPSSAEVKNDWHYTFPVPHISFWCAQGQLYHYGL